MRKPKGRKSDYYKQLGNSGYWQEVRRLVKIRDGHRCQKCPSTVNLEVHHTVYCVGGVSIVGREKEHLELMVTLCEVCHKKEHGK